MSRMIFTNGCFDLLHDGHLALLAFCKGLGTVTVGLNSDVSVRKLKGPSRPAQTELVRKKALEDSGLVERVVIFHEETPLRLITELEPDVIVKGGDYAVEDVVGFELAEVIIFPIIPGFSTSSQIALKKDNRHESDK